MTWICPHQVDAHCKRLNKKCKPGIKGCTLNSKVKFMNLDKEDKKEK